MSTARGRFLTFEGIEGSGKSTQAKRLARVLRDRGDDVLLTREPGGTPLGLRLRALLLDGGAAVPEPETELLLFCADRAEHVARVIRPALAAGSHVICDRFADATRAYQGLARGLGLEVVARADLTDLVPDRTILLDLEPEAGLGRARRRDADRPAAEGRFEAQDIAFHRRVRDGYLALAAADPRRIAVIAGDREPGTVFGDVLAVALAALAAEPGGPLPALPVPPPPPGRR